MNQQSWSNCSAVIQEQVHRLVAELTDILEQNLTGIYLHGSLAYGCFNHIRSDIDLLVFTQDRMPVETKQRVAQTLLELSENPVRLEVSFLSRDQIVPWRYPTPYDFHYGDELRDRLRQELDVGIWQNWNEEDRFDPDLAAHFTMTSKRGVCLYGEPISDAFPLVPPADFWSALQADLRWSRERASSVYGVLNHCRAWAYKSEGRFCSKDEGAVWALPKLPSDLVPVVTGALIAYRSEGGEVDTERDQILAFMDYLTVELDS